MPELPVRGLQSSDAGRQLVRLNWDYRNGIDRYGIARLTNSQNGKSLLILVLGHDDPEAIYMPYDIRSKLGIAKGDRLNFSIDKAGWLGKLCWYVKVPDPAVHVPAWIALIGFVVGLIGTVVGIVGFLSKN